MTSLTRRGFIGAASAAGAALAAGCATGKGAAGGARSTAPAASDFAWASEEEPLVAAKREEFDIVTRGGPGSRVLRQRTRLVPPGFDLEAVAARMRKTMLKAEGVGLAGPQVGLNLRVAVLLLDYKSEKPSLAFFRNPVIVERSDELVEGYEGCLSIPGVGGLVRRHLWVKVEHHTPKGEVLHAEAEGYNAVLWQHELDHLEGMLYVDRVLSALIPMEEVRRLRKEQEEKEKLEQSRPKDAPPPAAESRLAPDFIEGSVFLLA